MRSMWLCRKTNRRWAFRPKVVRDTERQPWVDLQIFAPMDEREVSSGTVSGARATCRCCGAVLPPERVRSQLAAQKGGADTIFDESGARIGGARMTAVVTLTPGQQGRNYRLPTESDNNAVRLAQDRIRSIVKEWENGGRKGLNPLPDELINTVRPSPNARGLSAVTRYGMSTFRDLFTARQAVALTMLGAASKQVNSVTDKELAMATALAAGRTADYSSSCCRWVARGEFIGNTFTRQALSVVWDFAEVNPIGASTGSFHSALEWVAKVIEAWPRSEGGQVLSADATDHPLPDQSANIWFTDPPYYDQIPYADLSDFFLVWLKRTLGTISRTPGSL